MSILVQAARIAASRGARSAFGAASIKAAGGAAARRHGAGRSAPLHRRPHSRLLPTLISALLLAALSGLPAGGWAATAEGPVPEPALASEPPPLGRAELVREVLAANPGLQALQAAVAQAQAGVSLAGALEDPTASYLSAPQTIGSDLGARHIVQLSQPLPWPGLRALQRSQAEARSRAESARRDDYTRELVRNTQALYARWEYAQAALRHNQAQQRLLADLADMVRGRYAAGRSAQSALLHVRLSLQHRRHAELDWRQSSAQLRAQLNALLNRPAAAPLTLPPLAAAPPSWPPPPGARPSSMGPEADPALAAVHAEVVAREQGVAIANRWQPPELRLLANYLGTLDPAEKRLQVGLGLRLPLNRARRLAERDAAQAALDQARHQQAALLAEQDAERAIAGAQWQSAQAAAALLRAEVLPLAEQSHAAALAAYRAGGDVVQAVTAAAQTLLDARLDLAAAQAQQWQAWADWMRWAMPATADNADTPDGASP